MLVCVYQGPSAPEETQLGYTRVIANTSVSTWHVYRLT
jgi:hypothetical protein